MSWETKFEVNRLSKIELAQELRLRSIPTTEQDSIDILRKLLRKAIRDGVSVGIACGNTEKQSLEFENIQNAFDEQDKELESSELEINALSQIITKFIHYKLRLSSLKTQDGLEITSPVKNILLEKAESIQKKIDAAYKKYQADTNARLGNVVVDKELVDINPGTPKSEQSTSNNQILTILTNTNQEHINTIQANTTQPHTNTIQANTTQPHTNTIQANTTQPHTNTIQTNTNMSYSGTHSQSARNLHSNQPNSDMVFRHPTQNLVQIPNSDMVFRHPTQNLVQINSSPNQGGAQIKIKTPTVTPPNFDGKSDIEEFLRDYTLACNLNQWTDQLKIHYLPLYLTGPAKILYDNEIRPQNVTTWAEVEAILKNFYIPVGNKDRIEWEMLTRKQGPMETAEEYFQQKIRLINKFDQNMTEDRKVKLLLYGLLPDIIAKVVCMGGNSTIQELRDNIKRTDLANYMVNVSVKGFQTFQTSQGESQPPIWSGSVNHIDRTNYNNQPPNDDLLREIAKLRGDIESLKVSSSKQHNTLRNNQFAPNGEHFHQPKYRNGGNYYNNNNNHNSTNKQVREHKANFHQQKRNIPFERTTTGKLIKCHKCNKVGHMARYCWSKNV
ncbi:hypothetical protein M8J77_009497 [Diaphorina citri]|nr:hypothetical protein M8J77_009497 [Diaphorina citri]